MKAREVIHCPEFLFFWVPRSFSGLPVVSCRVVHDDWSVCRSSVVRLSFVRSLFLLKTAREEETDAQQSRTLDRREKSGVSAESCACFQAGDCTNLLGISSCSLGCFTAAALRNWNCCKIWACGSLSLSLSLFCRRRRFCGLRRIMEKGWGLGNDARLLCGCAVTGSVRFVMKA